MNDRQRAILAYEKELARLNFSVEEVDLDNLSEEEIWALVFDLEGLGEED